MVRRRNILWLGVAAVLGLAPSTAFAATCAGVRVPDTLEVGGEKLVLNGVGLREGAVLRLDLYVAALYVKEKSDHGPQIAEADQPKLLRLSFLRDLSKSDLRKALIEGFKKGSAQAWPMIEARANTFFSFLPSFEAGQTLTLSYLPGEGLQVKAPGVASGTIEGFDFARALFLVWLGDHLPNKGMKKGLLGGRCN